MQAMKTKSGSMQDALPLYKGFIAFTEFR